MDKNVYEYISKQTNDPIVEWKTCKISGQPFAIFQSDIDFYEKISPIFNGVKYQIPTPTLCPEERQRRRLLWRNERKLYKRKCDATGKDILSVYSPEKKYTIYAQEYRWSDKRDPMQFGRAFDFDKSFSEQYNELLHAVPQMSLLGKMNQNCDYANAVGNCKNCYLIFDSDFCEDCYYASCVKNSKNVVDSMHIYSCEHIYNCINCTESYHLINCYECDRSHDLINCSKCSACEFCYNCNNLVQQKYCIDNKQYTKEEYMASIKDKAFSASYPDSLLRNTYMVKTEFCYGNNIYESKQCLCSYNIGDWEGLKYCELVTDAKDCYDISSYGGELSASYESCSIWFKVHHTYFSTTITTGIDNVFYSCCIWASSDCFGCVGLMNKSYCILNKQYTKEEYNALVPRIIEHMKKTPAKDGTGSEWWEFLDPHLSFFCYNETVAHEYFPLSKEEALARWYTWQDDYYDPVIPAWAETIRWDQIPSAISEVHDDILKKIFICEVSGRPFKLIKQELDFYHTYDIPLPRKHPDVRHAERVAKLPPRALYLRQCDKCNRETLSVYPGNYEGKVYCEGCYNKAIYW